jgi:hypothetical protein
VFLRQKLFSHTPGLLCVTLIGNVVPFEDAPGSVTGDLHNDSFGDTGPAQIPNRSPS